MKKKKVYFVDPIITKIYTRMVPEKSIEVDDKINSKFRRLWVYNKTWCGFASFKDARAFLIDWCSTDVQRSKERLIEASRIKRAKKL